MARIVITSAGTLGDFAPFVALGRRLRTSGHRVVMAINPAMVPLAEAAGLEAVPCGSHFGPDEARANAAVFDHWSRAPDDEIRAQWRKIDLGRIYPDLTECCRSADLLIGSTIQAAAPMVHERTGIPWVSVSLLPRDYPHADSPVEPLSEHDIRIRNELFDYLNQVRASLGFSSIPYHQWTQYSYSEDLVLLASSPHFSLPTLDIVPQTRMTGFWFNGLPGGWSPDDDLVKFLDADPKPLVLTMSSQPVEDASRVLAPHLEAATRLDRRLVVQGGWARLNHLALEDRSMRDRVLLVGTLPHEWLFPRASAVIHHGGIGTTAQAMRCGCPMLVEPYGNDQFFNARRVLALGVGAAMNPHKLTATGLSRILEERVLVSDIQVRVQNLATRLRAEDGLAMAHDLIEQYLAQGR